MAVIFFLCILFTIFAGLLALLVRCVRNRYPEEYAEALREIEEEDEHHAFKDKRAHFNIDGTMMANSMTDVRGKPYGVSGD